MRELIDIRREACPMTYVRVKLRLEALAEGEELEVWLAGEEAARSVPRSAKEEGHQVLSLTEQPGGFCQLLIRKQKRNDPWR